MGIATRLKLARLLSIAPADAGRLAALARAGFAGGADAVLTPGADDATLATIREAARGTQGLTGVLGRVRSASVTPDLVVLDDRGDAARVRALVGPWARIGRECNAADEVDAALADPDVDFLLVGPGRAHLRHAAEVAPAHEEASKPWFAVGGVSPDSLEVVLRAGAMRVAVGTAITQASDPEQTTRLLKARLRGAWRDDPRMEAVTASAFGASPGLDLAGGQDLPPTSLQV